MQRSLGDHDPECVFHPEEKIEEIHRAECQVVEQQMGWLDDGGIRFGLGLTCDLCDALERRRSSGSAVHEAPSGGGETMSAAFWPPIPNDDESTACVRAGRGFPRT